MFNLFKAKKDEADAMQLTSLKEEIVYPLFGNGLKLLPKACDVVPNATGAFGKASSSPIPVNGVKGSRIYLNRLRTVSGKGIFYHRIESLQPKGSDFMVDKYHVVGSDGSGECFIYICPYYPKRSTLPPEGFSMIPWSHIKGDIGLRFIIFNVALGSTAGPIPDFPFGLIDYLRKSYGGGSPDFGDSVSRQMKTIFDEFWMEDVRVKNDSGDLIVIKQRKKILKLR
jgi:hypothetical protein